MPNIIAMIFARGGSKGVPRKALQVLGNKPLISYTISDALTIKNVTKVFVNTDDEEIRSAAINYGAEVPFLRPKELAKDDSDMGLAHRYAIEWYEKNQRFISDIEIGMSPTYPFRRANLINNALLRGVNDKNIFNIGSVSKANKVFLDNYWVFKDNDLKRFQFEANTDSIPDRLYQGAFSFNIVFTSRYNLPNKRIPVLLNDIEAIDIDLPDDLDVARMVISEGLYPFKNEKN